MTTLNPPQVPGPPDAPGRTAGPRGSGSPRWRPWHGKPRARDVCCLIAIAVSALYAVAVIPLIPALIATHPVLLELVTGSNSGIVAAGALSDVNGRLQLAVVILAAMPGLMRFDWVFWWAGKLWGHRIVEKLGHRSPRSAALARIVERRGSRFAGPLVALSAFLPGGTSAVVYAAAGWAGLPLYLFLIFDAIGTAAWTTVLALLGHALGREGITLAGLVSRYALGTICVLVAAMFGPQAWRAWRERPGARGADRIRAADLTGSAAEAAAARAAD